MRIPSFLALFTSCLLLSANVAADLIKGLTAYLADDYETAVREWKASAEQGSADAQFNLALMYDEGEGVLLDDKEAVKWHTKAAEQGYSPAQNYLGVMYLNGEGVIQDNVYAHMWFNVANSIGSEMARDNRDIAAKRMTPDQLAEAQRLARECVKKDYKNC